MSGNRRSIRLKNYDYRQEGSYFITICAKSAECLFGKIKNDKMVLNDAGKIVEFTWMDLSQHNDNIKLDEYVIMPNHVHGIINIVIVGAGSVGAGSKPALNVKRAGLDRKRAGLEPAPTRGLPEFVRQFKTFSAKRINQMNKISNVCLWQRNYYEHIIRDEHNLNRIREYIKNNPANWNNDENNLRKL